MDKAEERRRWEVVHEFYRAAQLCYDQKFYRATVSCSYYACYQAMWVALGDPPTGDWKHGGIIQNFCRGLWADPVILPAALNPLRLKLLNLYDLRLVADYKALSINAILAKSGTDTVTKLMELITKYKKI